VAKIKSTPQSVLEKAGKQTFVPKGTETGFTSWENNLARSNQVQTASNFPMDENIPEYKVIHCTDEAAASYICRRKEMEAISTISKGQQKK
jgi:hypothetical protein